MRDKDVGRERKAFVVRARGPPSNGRDMGMEPAVRELEQGRVAEVVRAPAGWLTNEDRGRLLLEVDDQLHRRRTRFAGDQHGNGLGGGEAFERFQDRTVGAIVAAPVESKVEHDQSGFWFGSEGCDLLSEPRDVAESHVVADVDGSLLRYALDPVPLLTAAEVRGLRLTRPAGVRSLGEILTYRDRIELGMHSGAIRSAQPKVRTPDIVDHSEPAQHGTIHKERGSSRADRPLVVVSNQRRHGWEDVADVGAADPDELGAHKIVSHGTDDEDAVFELGQPKGIRAAAGRMVVDGKGDGVPVARPQKGQHPHQFHQQEASIVQAERVDPRRLSTQNGPAHSLKRIRMMCLDRVRENGGISRVPHEENPSRSGYAARMAGLTDREELIELLARYASIPDTRDFDELPETVFTDRVTWDFESVGAGPPIEMERDAFMQQLRKFFRGWQATHHAITNHRVRIDGDVASIRAHIYAQHWLAPDAAPQQHNRWLVVGFYDDEAVRTADGWRLRKVRLTMTYEERPEG